MALILCKECGREISDAATTCPHCGAPVKPSVPVKSNTKTYMVSALLIGIVAGIIAVANSVDNQNATIMFGAIALISSVAAVALSIKSKNEQ